MKKHSWSTLLAVASGLLIALCIYAPGEAAARGEQGGPADGSLEIHGDMLTGAVITALFNLKGYAIPAGSYASVNVRTVTSSSGHEPAVKAGYPETTLIFATPGTYELRFILNEVSKPSCGGVDARQLLEAVRVFTILPRP